MHTLPLLKPKPLKSGDTIALISSGFRILEDRDAHYAKERLEALGLKVRMGQAIFRQHGYLAGTDSDRAADINQLFADPDVKAIIQLRGGFGSARLLDLLDYPLIAKHPKIMMGMSDTTALLLALHQKTGLVTFHGPNAGRAWPAYTQAFVKDLLFAGKALTYLNPEHKSDDLITTEDRIEVITPGVAQGRLLGGNLTVLTSLVGSEYLPDTQDAILFLEEINEPPYKIDRMLTQLKLAGILAKLNGVIIGKFTHSHPNNPGSSYGSLRVMEVLKDHLQGLKIPAYYGAMISHETRMFTLPIGLPVEIDAEQGRIKLLEPGVE
ncbi:MAG TPA: LD-carboxypeptidase [Gammaproteobacteria bacterium]|nr:LD-carboxypeptidase [Gammaproteobacteria bacterium]